MDFFFVFKDHLAGVIFWLRLCSWKCLAHVVITLFFYSDKFSAYENLTKLDRKELKLELSCAPYSSPVCFKNANLFCMNLILRWIQLRYTKERTVFLTISYANAGNFNGNLYWSKTRTLWPLRLPFCFPKSDKYFFFCAMFKENLSYVRRKFLFLVNYWNIQYFKKLRDAIRRFMIVSKLARNSGKSPCTPVSSSVYPLVLQRVWTLVLYWLNCYRY